jgi:hypothetical protein
MRTAEDTVVVEVQTTCYHPARQPGNLCRDCSVVDGDGIPLVETGMKAATQLRYRHPMRAAINALRRTPASPGHPNAAWALAVLAAVGGDVSGASGALAIRYPLVRDWYRFFGDALRRCQDAYSEQVPWDRVRSWRPKSDAQLDAEAQPS